MKKSTKIILIIGTAALVAGVIYLYKKNKQVAVKPLQPAAPTVVTTKLDGLLKKEPSDVSATLQKFNSDGIELMITDIKNISGQTWYNVMDYLSGEDGWVSKSSVNIKL